MWIFFGEILCSVAAVMECNKEEAIWAKDNALEKMEHKNLIGAW